MFYFVVVVVIVGTMIPVSALQPDPIKGSKTIPMLGSWSSAMRI